MRADEYVVEQLKITQEQLRITKECYNKAKEDYKQLQEQTEKYCRLLDELKQYSTIAVMNNLKCIKFIYNDERYESRRIIAYDDERIYDILLELLEPLTGEEICNDN